jgi:hypothetical protein
VTLGHALVALALLPVVQTAPGVQPGVQPAVLDANRQRLDINCEAGTFAVSVMMVARLRLFMQSYA